MALCTLCPRQCNTDRESAVGYCGQQDGIRVARIAPHFFEEPPISASRGSGTVFFCGCSLACVFCQNKDISRSRNNGELLSDGELYARILALLEHRVHQLGLLRVCCPVGYDCHAHQACSEMAIIILDTLI